MRTTIRQTGTREVTLTYLENDEPHTRVFWIPNTTSGRGYIREQGTRGRADDHQVCEALYGTGNTLEATPETLLRTIRQEWRKHRAQEIKYGNPNF